MDTCKFAERLVQYRTEKGVTQEEVAQNLSVSDKTVSRWETGVSTPDLLTLAALAKYFGVTTDALLGISDNPAESIEEIAQTIFAKLDRKASILQAFALEKSIIPAIYSVFSCHPEDEKALPPSSFSTNRSQICAPDLFQYTVQSDDVNLSVSLLQNKTNFGWLRAADSQQKICNLFQFLSAPDVLSVLYFLHSTDCTPTCTADYLSAHTGVPEERVSTIMKELCKVGECRCLLAHLAEGDVNVYECFGDGILLSLISMAYEKMCGQRCYNYSFFESCKMIGGK